MTSATPRRSPVAEAMTAPFLAITPRPTVQHNMRIEPELYEALCSGAKKHGTTRSEYTRALIRWALQNIEQSLP
jgi:hypothetical protein